MPVKEFSRKSGYHRPNTLAKGYKANLKKAVKYIEEDGLKIHQAVSLAFGITQRTWNIWEKNAIEDLENGFTGTELLDVYFTVLSADANSERKLTRKARELALDDNNTEMLKFLLERRHGYKKQTQQEVEVATKDDLNFNINIVDSKPKKDDD